MLKNQRGIVLITVYLVIVILLILGGAFVARSISEKRVAEREKNSIKAFYIAEAGIERARYDLASDSDWFDGDINGTSTGLVKEDTVNFYPLNYSQDIKTSTAGEFTVWLKDTGQEGKIWIRSKGEYRDLTRMIEALIAKASIFDMAVFADERVSLDSNACIDSYDSESGPYGGENVGSDGDVGTNGRATSPAAISLDSNAKIDGDAVIGSGGNPEEAIKVEGSAEVTGTRSASDSEKELSQVTAPTDLPDRGSISLDGDETLTISERGKYSSIHLDSDSILTIDADATIYVTGTLAVDSNSQLQIADGATVTIYIDEALRVDSNAQINNLSKDPTKLDIYGTDSLASVSFDSDSVYYGTIYTRKADITLDSDISFYGSIIAKSVKLDSNAAIHYDEALGRRVRGPGWFLKVSSWREL